MQYSGDEQISSSRQGSTEEGVLVVLEAKVRADTETELSFEGEAGREVRK